MDGFSCTVKISHNFVDRELVSPKVYLARGSTKTPPPYKITSGYEDADKKIGIFDADDKITKLSFVSSGSMTYDIGKDYVLVVVWSVVKHGTFMLGDGKNGFYFAVLKRIDIKSSWQVSLKQLHDDAQKKMFEASTTGRYLELINKGPRETANFTVRAHMTNDKNAQLIVIIEDHAANYTTTTKRALATSMGMGALFTVVGTLSKMALRHLPTDTQSIVVTIQNDFADTTLEDPQWHLKQVIVFDSIPYEIPAQEERQITFKIPLGYIETKNPLDKTKHSAIFVTYRIKGSDKRLTFTIWWKKKFSLSESNHYSVSLMQAIIAPSLIEAITKDREKTGSGYGNNVLVASQYLNYQCIEEEYDAVETANGIETKTRKIVRVGVTMGDSTASNMIVNIAERKGNKLDIVVRSFQSCYEK